MTQERIETVLGELRDARGARGSAITATMTFVVYIDDPAIVRGVRGRMRELAQKYPSRVILCDATQRSKIAHADATFSQSEWVDLGVESSTAEELHSAVERLALADVPRIVMWGARASVAHERFRALSARANSVVCDSSLASDTPAALRDLADLCSTNPHLAMTDLSYLRLAPWQDCVAGFFDDDAVRSDIARIDHVEVTCGIGAEGNYVLGWLGSRIGWSPAHSGVFSTPTGRVRYAITRTNEVRHIRQIEIVCGETRYRAALDDADNATIVFNNTATAQSRHCRAIGVTDMASLVERAILAPATDSIFRESLALAAALQLYAAQP